MRRLLVLSFIFISGCGILYKFNENDKSTALLQMKLAYSQMQTGQYPQALVSFLKAEKLDPDNPQIQNGLGLAYWSRQRLSQAESHFKKAISLDPKYTDAKVNLGSLMIDKEDYKKSINYLSEAERDLTYPNPEKPLGRLGIAYFHLKQFPIAKTYLEKSIELKRDDCSAQNFLGRTQYSLGLYSESLTTFDRAIGFCQEIQNDEPHYFSAMALIELGKKIDAKARLQELVNLYPNGKYLSSAKQMLTKMKDVQ